MHLNSLLYYIVSSSSNARHFLAGSFAGITGQTVTYPLDLARTRLAIRDKNKGYKYGLTAGMEFG